MNFEKIGDEELWLLHADTQIELKKRGLVRTRNIVGERGEFLTIKIYSETANIPNLQAAPEGTQNIDALSRKGERYSIKTITEPNNTTGVFHGLGEKDDKADPEKKFEFLVIVQLFQDYRPKRIIELTWEQFLKNRSWHSTMRAWKVGVTQKLIEEANIILDNTQK